MKPKRLSAAATLETDLGPWEILTVNSNASAVQKQVVPWFIALYGLSYSRSIKLDVVKEMVIATSDALNLLECSQTAAEDFPVGLTDIAKRVKAAAGMYFDILLL